MSTRRRIHLKSFLLLALLVSLVGAACMVASNAILAPPPLFDGETQTFSVEIDDARDGTLEADVDGTSSSAPGVLADESAVDHRVMAAVRADADTIRFDCDHETGAGPVEIRCSGVAEGTFTIAELGDDAAFTVSLFQFPDIVPSEIDVGGGAIFRVDCGEGPSGQSIDIDESPNQKILIAPVGIGATRCEVRIELITAITSAGFEEDITVSARVTAQNTSATTCLIDSDCPPEEPICGPQQECQDGGTADACIVPSFHCDAGHGFCVNDTCTSGNAGAPCRFPGECAPGNTCEFGMCKGPDCSTDADCPPEYPNCTEEGCTDEGLEGQGCFLGFACVSGLCRSGVCTTIAGNGESCIGDVVCDGSLACFASTSTCMPRSSPGASCDADEECDGIQNGTHSCIGNVCQTTSPAGGACETTVDCSRFLFCFQGTCN